MFSNPRTITAAALALCSMGTTVNAIEIHIAAVEPTASGQIGVNLVDPIPSANALVGKTGKNTEYLTDIGGSTTSAGTVSTITRAASISVTQDDSTGNFNILIGPALRAKLIQIARAIPLCGARKKRAGSCGYTAFTEAVAQYGPHAEVAKIENAMPLGRLLIPANDIAQLTALFQAGAATITPGVVGLGTLGLLWVLYDQWVSNKDIAPVVDVLNSVAGTIPITTPTTTTSATSTASACPTNAPICANDRCKGEGDDEKKKCTVGDYKDCRCVEPEFDTPTDIPTEWIQIRLLVEQIILSEESQPVPECMDNNKVALETKLWKAMIINVCASKALDSEINAIQTAKDVGFPGYDGWSFAMTWKYGQGECTFGCEEMFNGFLGNTQCSYDSHTFSSSGKSTQSCGTASFVVNQPVPTPHIPDPPPNPPPSPPPAPPAPPAQDVEICGNGLFFQRDAAANAAKKFCESWPRINLGPRVRRA